MSGQAKHIVSRMLVEAEALEVILFSAQEKAEEMRDLAEDLIQALSSQQDEHLAEASPGTGAFFESGTWEDCITEIERTIQCLCAPYDEDDFDDIVEALSE